VARAAAIHWRSTANQVRFVAARRALESETDAAKSVGLTDAIDRLLQDEIRLAGELYALQVRDSRIGFEATNHYFYVPMDLVEKVLNCRDLLERWLPEARRRVGAALE
jgi:hypothetical protein